MGFPYMQIFKQWDPLTGNPPEYCTDQFEEIIRRARKLLKGRTSTEILNAQIALDHAYRHSYYDEMFEFEEGQTMDFVTLQKDMKKIKKYLKNNPIKEKDKFAWHENYATLILALTGSMALSNHRSDIRVELTDATEEELKITYEKIAYETINEAVVFLEISEEILPLHTHKQKAGEATHKDTTILKTQFIEYVEKHDSTNASEAARRFYRNRPNKELHLKVETDENIVRFFSKALRARIKDKEK